MNAYLMTVLVMDFEEQPLADVVTCLENTKYVSVRIVGQPSKVEIPDWHDGHLLNQSNVTAAQIADYFANYGEAP